MVHAGQNGAGKDNPNGRRAEEDTRKNHLQATFVHEVSASLVQQPL